MAAARRTMMRHTRKLKMTGGVLTPVLQELCDLVVLEPADTQADEADDDVPPPPMPPAPPAKALTPLREADADEAMFVDDSDGSTIPDEGVHCASPAASPDRTEDVEMCDADDDSDDVEIVYGVGVCNCEACKSAREHESLPRDRPVLRRSQPLRDSSEEAARAPPASAARGGQKPEQKEKKGKGNKGKNKDKPTTDATTAGAAAAPAKRTRMTSKTPAETEPEETKPKTAPKTAGAPDGDEPNPSADDAMFVKLKPPFELTHRQPSKGRRGEAYVLQSKDAEVRYTGISNQGNFDSSKKKKHF